MTLVYSFSLWNKFILHNCINVRKKTVSVLSELLLPFYLDIDIVDWSTEMTAAWSLGGTFEPTSHHLWLSWKEFWVSFRPFLMVLACADTFFLLLLTKQAGNAFCGNPVNVQIVFKNFLNWHKSNSQHVGSFVDSHSSAVRASSITWYTYLSVLLIWESP